MKKNLPAAVAALAMLAEHAPKTIRALATLVAALGKRIEPGAYLVVFAAIYAMTVISHRV